MYFVDFYDKNPYNFFITIIRKKTLCGGIHMPRIKTSELVPGMVTAEDVFNYSDTTYPYAYPSYGINSFFSWDDSKRYPILSKVTDPTKKIMLAETYHNANWTTHQRYIGYYAVGFNANGHSAYVSVLHGGDKSTNLAFVDGHVESISFPDSTKPYDVLTQNEYWNIAH